MRGALVSVCTYIFILLFQYDKLSDKFKSRDVKKQLTEVKREFLKLEPPTAFKKLIL